MKHTKGKWIAELHEVEETINDKTNPYQVATGETYICQRVEGLTKEEATANAKLISKAPEMYEALKDFANNWDNPEFSPSAKIKDLQSLLKEIES